VVVVGGVELDGSRLGSVEDEVRVVGLRMRRVWRRVLMVILVKWFSQGWSGCGPFWSLYIGYLGLVVYILLCLICLLYPNLMFVYLQCWCCAFWAFPFFIKVHSQYLYAKIIQLKIATGICLNKSEQQQILVVLCCAVFFLLTTKQRTRSKIKMTC
jgi:hypothetical protein